MHTHAHGAYTFIYYSIGRTLIPDPSILPPLANSHTARSALGGDARGRMNQYQFQAAKPPTEAEQRPTTDVFKSAAGQSEGFKSRFASTGNFTSAQLEEGADVDATAPEEPDPGVRSMLAALITRRPTRGDQMCVVQSLMTTGPSSHGSRSKRTPSKKSGSKRTPSKTRYGPHFSAPTR